MTTKITNNRGCYVIQHSKTLSSTLAINVQVEEKNIGTVFARPSPDKTAQSFIISGKKIYIDSSFLKVP